MTVLPVPEIVPTVALPLATPSTFQVTSVLDNPDTEAVKDWVALGRRLGALGLSTTATAAGGGTAPWVPLLDAAGLGLAPPPQAMSEQTVPMTTTPSRRTWILPACMEASRLKTRTYRTGYPSAP